MVDAGAVVGPRAARRPCRGLKAGALGSEVTCVGDIGEGLGIFCIWGRRALTGDQSLCQHLGR